MLLSRQLSSSLRLSDLPQKPPWGSESPRSATSLLKGVGYGDGEQTLAKVHHPQITNILLHDAITCGDRYSVVLWLGGWGQGANNLGAGLRTPHMGNVRAWLGCLSVHDVFFFAEIQQKRE